MNAATNPRRDPLALGAVLLTGVAFAGSFVHVQRTVAEHGQGGWLSWAIAAMPELSVLLAVLRVRRDGARQVWPWIVGGTAAAFTVSANLAQAEGTTWGWVVAGWPAWAALGAGFLVELGGSGESDPIEDPIGSAQSLDPIDPIRSTARSIEGLRSVASSTRSSTPRSTVALDPIDPPRSDPDRTRSARLGTRSDSELLAELRASIDRDDPIPSAEAIRVRFSIAPRRARALRDALQADRTQPGPGAVQGEIN